MLRGFILVRTFLRPLSTHTISMPGKTKSANGMKCINGPTNTFTVSTPIGDMELVTCPKGVHSLQLTAETDSHFLPDLSQEVKIVEQLYEDNGYTYKPAGACVDWLEVYFRKPSAVKACPKPVICHLQNLDDKARFTQRVWKVLFERVLFGERCSYTELAGLTGASPHHARAVGTAMRNNPVSIIVPCHRVLPSTGSVGNYSGGTKNSVKAWLLDHESNSAT